MSNDETMTAGELALIYLRDETDGFESQSRLRDDVIDAMVAYAEHLSQTPKALSDEDIDGIGEDWLQAYCEEMGYDISNPPPKVITGLGTIKLGAMLYREKVEVRAQLQNPSDMSDTKEWAEIDPKNPPQGEVILHNPKWVHPDWNEYGIRIGYHYDLSGWMTAAWCNQHDEYHTRTSEHNDDHYTLPRGEDQTPTHYMEIPKPQVI